MNNINSLKQANRIDELEDKIDLVENNLGEKINNLENKLDKLIDLCTK